MKTLTKKWLVAMLAVLFTVCLAFGITACTTDGGEGLTTLDAPEIVLNDQTGEITWKPVDNATHYAVYENDGTVPVKTVAAPKTSYTIEQTVPGTYTYTVAATSTDTSNYKASAKSNSVSWTINPKLSVADLNNIADSRLKITLAANSTLVIDLVDVAEDDYYFAATDDLNAEGFKSVAATLTVGESNFDLSVAQPVKVTVTSTTKTISIKNDSSSGQTLYLLLFEYEAPTQLGTPDVSLSGRKLSWSSVQNADFYVIYLGAAGTEVKFDTTTQTSYTYNGVEAGDHVLSVAAVSNYYLYSESEKSTHHTITIGADLHELGTPTVTLKGNALNWTSVDGASGYEVYEDGEVVATYDDTLTSYAVQNYKGTSHEYKVVAITNDVNYAPGAPSAPVTYTVGSRKLSLNDSVDSFYGEWEGAYSMIELATDVDLGEKGKYYKVSVEINTQGIFETDEHRKYYIENVQIVGNASQYEKGDDGNNTVTVYENNADNTAYNDHYAHHENGVFTGELGIIAKDRAIVVYIGYMSLKGAHGHVDVSKDDAIIGFTVSLLASDEGEYTPPEEPEEPEEVLTLNGSVSVTIPANGKVVEIAVDPNLEPNTYLISVFYFGTATIYWTDSMGIDAIAFTVDGTPQYVTFIMGNIYLKTDSDEPIDVTIYLFEAPSDPGEVGEGELAKGHDVTVDVENGEVKIPYSYSTANSYTQHLVKVVNADPAMNNEDFVGLLFRIQNYSDEDGLIGDDPESLECDYDNYWFSLPFMPYGDKLVISVYVWDSNVGDWGSYVAYTGTLKITVSLEDYSGGGDDDNWLYSDTQMQVSLQSVIGNTASYKFEIAKYSDEYYTTPDMKFGVAGDLTDVTVTITGTGTNLTVEFTDAENYSYYIPDLPNGEYTITFTYTGEDSVVLVLMMAAEDSYMWEYFPSDDDDPDGPGGYPAIYRDVEESVSGLGYFENVAFVFTADVNGGTTYKIVLKDFDGDIDDLWIQTSDDGGDNWNQLTNVVQTADGYEVTFDLAYENSCLIRFYNWGGTASFTVSVTYAG